MNPNNDDEPPEPPEVSEVESTGIAAEGPGLQGASRGGTDVQAYIGRQLRAVYDDVVKQPIPDRFLALMKQLEERSAKG